MKHRKIMIGSFAVATAILSMSVNAATRTDGLTACAKAAVFDLGEQQDMELGYSLSSDSITSGVRLEHREVFHLDITKPDSNTIVARVDCIVDRKAKVRGLIKVPIDGKEAIVRANS